ncbi:MAG: hypothetical protein R3B72_32890 [Polyangiaceae bacterium]
MEIVSDRLVFGEAKGIWGVGLLKILPPAPPPASLRRIATAVPSGASTRAL